MSILKDFVWDRFVVQIRPKCALALELAHFCSTKRRREKSLAMNIGTISRNMPTNFKPKRLKTNLDIIIFEKPEN